VSSLLLEAYARDRIQDHLRAAQHAALVAEARGAASPGPALRWRAALALRLRVLAQRLDPSVLPEPSVAVLTASGDCLQCSTSSP
jgi:hypothetical protein